MHDERCRSCRAPIRLETTNTGKTMPLDPEPSGRGNVALMTAEGAEIDLVDVAVVLGGDQLAAARGRGVKLYLPHFASCPNARAHRRR